MRGKDRHPRHVRSRDRRHHLRGDRMQQPRQRHRGSQESTETLHRDSYFVAVVLQGGDPVGKRRRSLERSAEFVASHDGPISQAPSCADSKVAALAYLTAPGHQ